MKMFVANQTSVSARRQNGRNVYAGRFGIESLLPSDELHEGTDRRAVGQTEAMYYADRYGRDQP